MRVDILNGNNDYSRIYPDRKFMGKQLNGFSRVNVNGRGLSPGAIDDSTTWRDPGINGYTLNGYTLNGALEFMDDEVLAEFLVDVVDGDPTALQGCVTMDGLKAWFQKRRDKKAARQMRRGGRQDYRSGKRGLRLDKMQAKIARIRERTKTGGFLGKVAEIGERFLSDKFGGGEAGIPDVMQAGAGFLDDPFAGPNGPEQRGLFGPPSLFKDPLKWFQSDKVPVIQKVGAAAVVALALDAAVNKGKFRKKILGKK